MELKYIIDEALGRSEVESRIKPTSMIQSDEELVSVLEELTTVIRVIGCGGGGSNTIDRLAECGIQGAELFAINTDAQHLLHINADRRFLIGRRTTRGLGAGSLPAIGEEAAEEDIDEIKAAVAGADMIFVTCASAAEQARARRLWWQKQPARQEPSPSPSSQFPSAPKAP